jgi:hypothetical protein
MGNSREMGIIGSPVSDKTSSRQLVNRGQPAAFAWHTLFGPFC